MFYWNIILSRINHNLSTASTNSNFRSNSSIFEQKYFYPKFCNFIVENDDKECRIESEHQTHNGMYLMGV